jgi:hypothetical protein
MKSREEARNAQPIRTMLRKETQSVGDVPCEEAVDIVQKLSQSD